MNKEFYEDARKVAESCSKERLVELYLAEVQTCCELEEQLANAIVPKFKVGDKVYANTVDYWENSKPVRHTTQEEVKEIVYFYKLNGYWLKDWKEQEIFATEEEARAKLKEIQGE